jgi:hypothetical protein
MRASADLSRPALRPPCGVRALVAVVAARRGEGRAAFADKHQRRGRAFPLQPPQRPQFVALDRVLRRTCRTAASNSIWSCPCRKLKLEHIGGVARKGPPALRRRPSSFRHVLCHGGLADIHAELKEFGENFALQRCARSEQPRPRRTRRSAIAVIIDRFAGNRQLHNCAPWRTVAGQRYTGNHAVPKVARFTTDVVAPPSMLPSPLSGCRIKEGDPALQHITDELSECFHPRQLPPAARCRRRTM